VHNYTRTSDISKWRHGAAVGLVIDIYMSGVLKILTSLRCLLEQETLTALLRTGWLQERIRV